MFKKTLIAAALAAVTGSAMADVTVSGQVKATFTDKEASTGYDAGFDNSLDFKATEDLGNGMSAFAQISIDTDEGGAANTAGGSKDQKLGLKGGFGTVVIGRMETLTQGAVSTMMDDGAGNANLETNITNVGRRVAVAYVSPTINGFHVAVAGTATDADPAAAADGMLNSTDILAAYDNGPLSVKVAFADLDKADAAGNNTTGTEVLSIGASYKMGDAKLSALTVNADAAGTDTRDTMYRLDYTMGNNVILLGLRDAEDGDDVTALKLTHNLSKRTSAYVGLRNFDTSADHTYFGMMHKF